MELVTPEPNGCGPGRGFATSIALLGCLAASCGDRPQGSQARWETAERISPASASGDSTAPSVAMDPSGNAAAIWRQKTDGTVWAARRPTNRAWEPPTLLDTQVARFFSSNFAHAVAMDAAGAAAAVWGGFDGSVWASWSAPGGPWTAPVRLTEPGEVGLDPTVALDPTGAGFAVWQTGRPGLPGRETRIRARRVAGGRWESAQEIQLSFAETGGRPQVAVGNDGTGVAVWDELRNGVSRIWANRYRPEAGWGVAQPISPQEEREGAIWADVGIDALGNAMAVWTRFFGGSLRDIGASRLNAKSGWGTVVTVAAGRPYPEYPRVAVDPAGNALVVWHEGSSEAGLFEVWGAWFDARSGWGPAQRLQSASEAGADVPGVAMDARGNGIAVWRGRAGGMPIVWAARFQPTGGWGQPEAIGTGLPARTEVGPVAIALSPGGDGVAAWQQWDGTRLVIWANRFAATGPAPSTR